MTAKDDQSGAPPPPEVVAFDKAAKPCPHWLEDIEVGTYVTAHHDEELHAEIEALKRKLALHHADAKFTLTNGSYWCPACRETVQSVPSAALRVGEQIGLPPGQGLSVELTEE